MKPRCGVKLKLFEGINKHILHRKNSCQRWVLRETIIDYRGTLILVKVFQKYVCIVFFISVHLFVLVDLVFIYFSILMYSLGIYLK